MLVARVDNMHRVQQARVAQLHIYILKLYRIHSTPSAPASTLIDV